MPSNHYSGSDTSRPEMGTMGIMNRARGMQIVENSFHVRMMFLLLGLLLSIVNLPTASGANTSLPPVNSHGPPPPSAQDQPPSPASPPNSLVSPQPPVAPPLSSGTPLPPGGPSPTASPPSSASGSSPASYPPPSPSTKQPTDGDTWNESEKAGVVIASIAALLQVAVVAFLLIKRHQMLTTVEYDDIEDLEYDTPPDSNFRDIESA